MQDNEKQKNLTPESEGIAGKGEVLEALQHAQEFIRNGVELGFIRMPDKDTPDPAHLCLPKIEQAIKTLAATKEEIDEVCMCGNYFSDHTGYEGHPFVSMGSPDDESTLTRPQEIDVAQLKREARWMRSVYKADSIHHAEIVADRERLIDAIAASGYLSAPQVSREKELMTVIADLDTDLTTWQKHGCKTIGIPFNKTPTQRKHHAIIYEAQAQKGE